MMQTIERYLADNKDRFVRELLDFLKIPSVSAISTHNGDTRKAGEWVRDQLNAAGVKAELVETEGHPIVYGEWTKAKGAPTVLVYGHYDVQPVDPLNEWKTPPFQPDIREGHVFARGATDDKGQMLTHVKSAEAWLKSSGSLPVNLKFVIEGEEEVGSNNLDLFLEARRKQLACDVAVVSDTSQYAPGIPAITYGLRGIVACELTVHGPRQDLHSGIFGGSIANPCNVLAKLIAQLHDDDGRVQVPGFYDDVAELSAEERREFQSLPFDEAAFLKELGSPKTCGEKGYSTLERRWARPTCDVNGLTGGYQGEGPKTIIPAKASAKITCRLVPDQDNDRIIAAVEKFFRDRCPKAVRMEFKIYHGCPATVCDIHSPWMKAARAAIKKGFGKEPVLIREGGSIPVVGTFKKLLGVDTLLLGWGQNTDNLHGPNERFSLDAFHSGIHSSAALWEELARK